MTPEKMTRLDDLRRRANSGFEVMTPDDVDERARLELEASRLEFMQPDSDGRGGLKRGPSDQAQLDREVRDEVRETAAAAGKGLAYLFLEFVKALFRRG